VLLGIMTAKLLSALLRCFDDAFATVRGEACGACSRLRVHDSRVVARLARLINDDQIHRVKALAIQGHSTANHRPRRQGDRGAVALSLLSLSSVFCCSVSLE